MKTLLPVIMNEVMEKVKNKGGISFEKSIIEAPIGPSFRAFTMTTKNKANLSGIPLGASWL